MLATGTVFIGTYLYTTCHLGWKAGKSIGVKLNKNRLGKYSPFNEVVTVNSGRYYLEPYHDDEREYYDNDDDYYFSAETADGKRVYVTFRSRLNGGVE